MICPSFPRHFFSRKVFQPFFFSSLSPSVAGYLFLVTQILSFVVLRLLIDKSPSQTRPIRPFAMATRSLSVFATRWRVSRYKWPFQSIPLPELKTHSSFNFTLSFL